MKQGLADVRGEMRQGFAEVRTELHALAEYTQTGFAALLQQGDRRFLDHEGRIRRLEANAGLVSGPG
jgi:hypothetical protein